jgi:hypothetical protein
MGRSAKIRHRRQRRERRWVLARLRWHQSFTGGHVTARLLPGVYVLRGTP